jgi:diguanylate cyclase (GGDEF)-like protein
MPLTKQTGVTEQDIGKLRRIFVGSFGLCVLIVLYLYLYGASADGRRALTQAYLLCMLLWALVVTYYVFHTLSEMMHKADRTIRELRDYDRLTGVYSLEYLYTTLEKKHDLFLDGDKKVTIGYVRLLGLDAVNKEFGHATGNIVLRGLAKAMAEALPQASFLARLNGAEFVAFMPDTGLDAAREILKKICLTVKNYKLDLASRGVIENIRATAGLTAYTSGHQSVDGLILEARNNPIEV